MGGVSCEITKCAAPDVGTRLSMEFLYVISKNVFLNALVIELSGGMRNPRYNPCYSETPTDKNAGIYVIFEASHFCQLAVVALSEAFAKVGVASSILVARSRFFKGLASRP